MTVVRSPGLRALTAAAVVLVHAGAQAALIGVAPRLPLDAAAIALAVVSGLAMLAAAAILWTLALRGMSGHALTTLTIAALGVAACAVAAPVLIPIAVAVASPFVAAATPSAAWAAARQWPWRTAIRLIATAVAVASGSVVAMLLGLLAPGPLGAAVAWTVIGAGAAVIIGVWARWAHPVPSPDRAQP